MTVACRSVVRFTLIVAISYITGGRLAPRSTVRGPILTRSDASLTPHCHTHVTAHTASALTAHWHQSARVPITHQPSDSFSILSPSRIRYLVFDFVHRLLLAPFPLPLSSSVFSSPSLLCSRQRRSGPGAVPSVGDRGVCAAPRAANALEITNAHFGWGRFLILKTIVDMPRSINITRST